MFGSTFVDASLLGIEVNGGDWSYTNLRSCSLKGLNLRCINLSNADLSMCDLENTNLRDFNLSHAILIQAKMNGADMREANVDGVDFKSFSFKGVHLDMSQAIAVARCYGAVIG